jgi:hypothetical protein
MPMQFEFVQGLEARLATEAVELLTVNADDVVWPENPNVSP